MTMENPPSLDVCLTGHEERQELEALLMLPRIVEPLKDYRMNIVLGPGNVKRTSVSELAEEYKKTEGGRLILNWGSLTVPVADFVKDKLRLKSVETLERMEREKVEEMVRYVITYDPRLPPVSQLLFNN